MSLVGGGRAPYGATALLLVGSLLGAAALTTAQAQNTSLEPLLKVSDLAEVGLKDIVLAPPDAFDRTEELGFQRASDEWPVINFSRLQVGGPGGGTLHETLSLLATDVAAVSGVGDEAYSYLGGAFLAFRKGNVAFQLMSGLDVMAGAKPFLTTAQLAQLAKVVCGRI